MIRYVMYAGQCLIQLMGFINASYSHQQASAAEPALLSAPGLKTFLQAQSRDSDNPVVSLLLN